jgi:CRP-like cAMP-binding protein
MVDINLLKSIPFFESFPEEEISLMGTLCETRAFQAKKTVLQQGDINTELFFLIDGTVSVFMDNKSIVSVTGDGEVFGEMSLAAHSPTTATVITKTICQFVVINFSEIRPPQNPAKNLLLFYCWRSIAEVLARKLIITNEIAKTYRIKYKNISNEKLSDN